MSSEQMLYNNENRIATITLNRPKKLNAWTCGVTADVRGAMYKASDDDAVSIPNSPDLLYSARTIDAYEAKEMGPVNRVFPEDDFMKEVNTYVAEPVEAVSPRSMNVMKRRVYRAQFQGLA